MVLSGFNTWNVKFLLEFNYKRRIMRIIVLFQDFNFENFPILSIHILILRILFGEFSIFIWGILLTKWEGFRRGRFQILVATDIAARGLDVANISDVVNYDLPNVPEDRISLTFSFRPSLRVVLRFILSVWFIKCETNNSTSSNIVIVPAVENGAGTNLIAGELRLGTAQF